MIRVKICYTLSISTIVRQFGASKKVLSLGMALFFVGGTLAVNASIFKAKSTEDTGILGGPSVAAPLTEDMENASLSALPAVSSVADTPPSAVSSLSEASLAPNAPLSLKAGDPLNPGVLQAAADEEIDTAAPAPKPTLKLTHYFIQPSAGTNWGILHAHNAVDIANVCGTPIVAAAGGVVTAADGGGNWNGGYGNYVEIEHPNGVSTKYAHLQSVSAAIGDEVRQGAQIGTIGATGHVVGATGCHLHFEVHGAVNPFAKN